jgi:hypothetical protein
MFLESVLYEVVTTAAGSSFGSSKSRSSFMPCLFQP